MSRILADCLVVEFGVQKASARDAPARPLTRHLFLLEEFLLCCDCNLELLAKAKHKCKLLWWACLSDVSVAFSTSRREPDRVAVGEVRDHIRQLEEQRGALMKQTDTLRSENQKVKKSDLAKLDRSFEKVHRALVESRLALLPHAAAYALDFSVKLSAKENATHTVYLASMCDVQTWLLAVRSQKRLVQQAVDENDQAAVKRRSKAEKTLKRALSFVKAQHNCLAGLSHLELQALNSRSDGVPTLLSDTRAISGSITVCLGSIVATGGSKDLTGASFTFVAEVDVSRQFFVFNMRTGRLQGDLAFDQTLPVDLWRATTLKFQLLITKVTDGDLFAYCGSFNLAHSVLTLSSPSATTRQQEHTLPLCLGGMGERRWCLHFTLCYEHESADKIRSAKLTSVNATPSHTPLPDAPPPAAARRPVRPSVTGQQETAQNLAHRNGDVITPIHESLDRSAPQRNVTPVQMQVQCTANSQRNENPRELNNVPQKSERRDSAREVASIPEYRLPLPLTDKQHERKHHAAESNPCISNTALPDASNCHYFTSTICELDSELQLEAKDHVPRLTADPHRVPREDESNQYSTISTVQLLKWSEDFVSSQKLQDMPSSLRTDAQPTQSTESKQSALVVPQDVPSTSTPHVTCVQPTAELKKPCSTRHSQVADVHVETSYVTYWQVDVPKQRAVVSEVPISAVHKAQITSINLLFVPAAAPAEHSPSAKDTAGADLVQASEMVAKKNGFHLPKLVHSNSNEQREENDAALTARDGATNAVLQKPASSLAVAAPPSKLPARLIPLFFHQVCGANVQIEQDGTVARRTKSFCQGITFGSRPVQCNERMYVKLSQVSLNWTGTLRVGLTMRNPRSFGPKGLPESSVLLQLKNSAEVWSVSIPDRLTEESFILHFRLSDNGVLYVGHVDEQEEQNLLRIKGFTTPKAALWPIFDVYGKALEIELLGTCQLPANDDRASTSWAPEPHQRMANGLANGFLRPESAANNALRDATNDQVRSLAGPSNAAADGEDKSSILVKYSPIPGEATLRRRIGEMKKLLLAQQEKIVALKQAARVAALQNNDVNEIVNNDLVVDYTSDARENKAQCSKNVVDQQPTVIATYDDEDTQEKTQVMMARSELKLTYTQAKLACEIEENLPSGGNLSFEDVVQAAQCCKNLQDSLAYLQCECPLCFDKVPRHKMVDVYLCNCKLCTSCFKAHYQIVIREKPLSKWSCPLCESPNDTDVEGILEHLWWLSEALRNVIDPVDYDLFTSKNAHWTMMRMHNFRWCSHCGNGFIYDGSEYNMQCPNCMKSTCFECGKPWQDQHKGVSCSKFQEWKEKNDPDYQAQGLRKHLEENGIQCPNCKFLYFLSRGGCLHFSCIQCEYQFCSGCGGAFVKGEKCGRGQACRHAGLHCHHPRNCFYYLRDRPIKEMHELLRKSKVDWNSHVKLKASGDMVAQRDRCGVLEQKETVHGLQDDICGRPIFQEVYAANLCEQHYKEYLASLINKQGIDPADLLTMLQLEEQLHSANVPVARPLYLRLTDDGLPDETHWSVRAYHSQLVKEVKRRIPLHRQ